MANTRNFSFLHINYGDDKTTCIDNTNVLVANLKPPYIGHYDHVGSGVYPFQLP